MTTKTSGKKLEIGRLLATAGVMAKCEAEPTFAAFVSESFRRHAAGDWGELSQDDKDANDVALADNDGRVFSAYTGGPEKIWLITEADRSLTTILFPDEY